MKKTRSWANLLVLILAMWNGHPDFCPAQERPGPESALAIMRRVADWQLANPDPDPKSARDGWQYAACYAGVMALGGLVPETRYHEVMVALGESLQWRLAKRMYHADDQAVGQTYAELYAVYHRHEMIAAMRAQFDAVMASPKDDDLDFSKPGVLDKWSWCDSLFMAPPAWARLARVTGEQKYLDFANRNWWVTSQYLYDKDEHLFYRDSRFFTRREPNGLKIFWSRGNGWVMAGLARMLQSMPKDYPDRPRYEEQFKVMAAKIGALQQPDGLWRPGLLDPVAHPEKETSGSGFFCYALAWGINEGLLDRRTYEPVVLSAWNALTGCVSREGKLGYVQPVGDSPKGFDASETHTYGVGAFLLAGSEVYRLVGGKANLSHEGAVSGSAPERQSDLARQKAGGTVIP